MTKYQRTRPAICHPTKADKGRGLCGACYDKVLKQQNPEYRLRQLKNTAQWKKKNPKTMARYSDEAKQHRLGNKELYKQKNRDKTLQKYGLTQITFEAILARQGGGCALCHRPQGKLHFHVDHHHVSNRVRGILCHQCNWYLGKIDKDPGLIRRIIAYLHPETIIDFGT